MNILDAIHWRFGWDSQRYMTRNQVIDRTKIVYERTRLPPYRPSHLCQSAII